MDLVTYGGLVLLIFLATVAAMRLLGKSAIVQLTPYDLATIVLLGTVLAEPLVGPEPVRALLAAGLIVLAHIGLAKLTLTPWGGRWLLGEPEILIKHGQVVERALERSGTSIAQLLAFLRAAGHPQIRDVEYAILEPTGQLSVIPRASARPVTPADLQLPEPDLGLPLPLVVDGRIHRENLRLIGRDEEWLRRHLRRQGITDLRPVMVALLSENGRLTVDLRGRGSRSVDVDDQA